VGWLLPYAPGKCHATKKLARGAGKGDRTAAADGNNIFAAGFLELDNIGIFDRSKPVSTGGYLHQAYGTAWMAFYCKSVLDRA
jgi:hypothetical protein